MGWQEIVLYNILIDVRTINLYSVTLMLAPVNSTELTCIVTCIGTLFHECVVSVTVEEGLADDGKVEQIPKAKVRRRNEGFMIS